MISYDEIQETGWYRYTLVQTKRNAMLFLNMSRRSCFYHWCLWLLQEFLKISRFQVDTERTQFMVEVIRLVRNSKGGVCPYWVTRKVAINLFPLQTNCVQHRILQYTLAHNGLSAVMKTRGLVYVCLRDISTSPRSNFDLVLLLAMKINLQVVT